MAHSFLKQYSKQFRMIKVHYMDNVFKAYARAFGWIFLSYETFDY